MLGIGGGLVALWLFNEGSGDKVFDLSGNGNTGSLVADTHFVSGKFGPALDFDGTGDYVNCGSGSSILITDPHLTYSVWVKWTPRTRWTGLMGTSAANKGASLNFVSGDTDVRWKVYKAVGSVSVYAPATANVWMHIVGVVDGTTVRIYRDGVETGNAAFAGDMPEPTEIWIGDNWDNPLEGQIDNAAIYKRALSAYEIALLYREPFSMLERVTIQPIGNVGEYVFKPIYAPDLSKFGYRYVPEEITVEERRAPDLVKTLAGYVPEANAPKAKRQSRMGFKPISGADRLRGIRRNSLY